MPRLLKTVLIVAFLSFLIPSIGLAELMETQDVPFALNPAYETYFGSHPYNGTGIDEAHRRVMEQLRWCIHTPIDACWQYESSHTNPAWVPPVIPSDPVNCPNWLDKDFPKDVRFLVLKYLQHYDTGEPWEIVRPNIRDNRSINVDTYKRVFAANIAHSFWMEIRGRVPWRLTDMAERAANSPRGINDYHGGIQHVLDARCLLREETALNIDIGRLDVFNQTILWNPRILYDMVKEYAASWPRLPANIEIDEADLDLDGSPSLKVRQFPGPQTGRETLVQLIRYFDSQTKHASARTGDTGTNVLFYSADSTAPLEGLSFSGTFPELEINSGYVRRGCPGAHELLRAILRIWNTPVFIHQQHFHYEDRDRDGDGIQDPQGPIHATSFIPDLGPHGLGVFNHNDTLYSDWTHEDETALDSIPVGRFFVPLETMQGRDRCVRQPQGGLNFHRNNCVANDPAWIDYVCHATHLAHLQIEYPNFGAMRRYCFDWCLENGGYWSCDFPDAGFSLEWGSEYTSNCTCMMNNPSECPPGGCGPWGWCQDGHCISPRAICNPLCPPGQLCNDGVCTERLFTKDRVPPIRPLEGPPGAGGIPDPDENITDGATVMLGRYWDFPWWQIHWGYDPVVHQNTCPAWRDLFDNRFNLWATPATAPAGDPDFETSILNPPADSWIPPIDRQVCDFFFNYDMNLQKKRNKWKIYEYLQNDYGLDDRTLLDRAGNTAYLDWGETNCIDLFGRLVVNPAADPYSVLRQCGLDLDGNGPYIVETNGNAISPNRIYVQNSPIAWGRISGLRLNSDNSSLSFRVDRSSKLGKDILVYTMMKDRSSSHNLVLEYRIAGGSWTSLGFFGTNTPPPSNDLYATHLMYALPNGMIWNATSIEFRYRYECNAPCVNFPADGAGDDVFLTMIKFAEPKSCGGASTDVDYDGLADGCDSCPTTHSLRDADQDCIEDRLDQCKFTRDDEDLEGDCISDSTDNCSPLKVSHQCAFPHVDCWNQTQENSDELAERQNGWEERGDACDDRPILNPWPFRFIRIPASSGLPTVYASASDKLYIPFVYKLPKRYEGTQHRHVQIHACRCAGADCQNCGRENGEYREIHYRRRGDNQHLMSGEILGFSTSPKAMGYEWRWLDDSQYFNAGNRIMIRFSHWQGDADMIRVALGPIDLPQETQASPPPNWGQVLPKVSATSSNWVLLTYTSTENGSRFVWNPSSNYGTWLNEDADDYSTHASTGMAVATGFGFFGKLAFRGMVLPEEVYEAPPLLQFYFSGVHTNQNVLHNDFYMSVTTASGTKWYDLSLLQRFFPEFPVDEGMDMEDGNYVPKPRLNGEMYLDAVRKQVVLAGGHQAISPDDPSISGTPIYDVDVFDLTTLLWNSKGRIPFSLDSTTARKQFKTAFRSLNNELWIFGGASAQSGAQAEGSVFVLDLSGENGWQEVSFAGEHPARIGHSVTYDYITDRFYFYGGTEATTGDAGTAKNDIWVLDPAARTWEQHYPGGEDGPVPYLNTPIVYDAYNNRLVILQPGQTGDDPNAPSYYFDLGAWYAINEIPETDGDADGDADQDIDQGTPDPGCPGGCLGPDQFIRAAGATESGGNGARRSHSGGTEFFLYIILPLLTLGIIVRRLGLWVSERGSKEQ